MTIPNRENQKQPIAPNLEAREMMHWKVDADIITIYNVDLHEPVAFIKLERYDEQNKKPVFSARDIEGNVLVEETQNLYELKKTIRDKASESISQTPAEVTPEAVPTKTDQKQPPQSESKGAELKKVRNRKATPSKDNEQSVSH